MGVDVFIVKELNLLNLSDLIQAEMFTDEVVFKRFIHITFSNVAGFCPHTLSW